MFSLSFVYYCRGRHGDSSGFLAEEARAHCGIHSLLHSASIFLVSSADSVACGCVRQFAFREILRNVFPNDGQKWCIVFKRKMNAVRYRFFVVVVAVVVVYISANLIYYHQTNNNAL